MSDKYYDGIVITYEHPITSPSGDEIAFEKYALESEISMLTISDYRLDMAEIGSALIPTTEGLLMLNSANVVSIVFEEAI